MCNRSTKESLKHLNKILLPYEHKKILITNIRVSATEMKWVRKYLTYREIVINFIFHNVALCLKSLIHAHKNSFSNLIIHRHTEKSHKIINIVDIFWFTEISWFITENSLNILSASFNTENTYIFTQFKWRQLQY